MKTLVILAAAGSGGLLTTVREVGEQFGVDWPHFLAQCLSFAMVAFLLHWFGYRPALQILEERKQRIAESMANAEKIKAELAKTEAARKEILAQAEQQAVRMIEEARAAANRLLEQETNKAKAAAQQIIARAQEAGEAELARMRAELRREIGRLVVETTARVAGKVLTREDHDRLIEEANRELAA
ncbi:MAG: F0F1 ATP synthase subunit B [Verrucomicrobiae bacterium]|nr:F0F1 ATP synthase subunit B [Verrucomicrobiae bacterium]